MADSKLADLTANTAPASGDLLYSVDVSDTSDGATGTNKKVTHADTITKSHGLSDSTVVGVSGGVMTSGTDVAVADGGTGASTASGARTNLGLAIGSDVQAYDAELAALAGLTSAADKLPYFTGSGTAALTDIPSAARTALSSLSGSNTGDQTISDATISTTDITTNNASTSKHGFLPKLDNNSAHYLDGTGAWSSISAAKTTFKYVVAASGGDYTTLGAALAAMSNGDSVFVKSGTYTESAITCSLTNINIVGESPENTVISMTSNALTLSGAFARMTGLKITNTTGTMTFSGGNQEIVGCHFAKSSTGAGIAMTGDSYQFKDNYCVNTSTEATAKQFSFVSAATVNGPIITGNTFVYNPTNTSQQTCYFSHNANTTHNGAVIANNKFLWSSSGGYAMVYIDTSNQTVFANNTIRNADTGQHCLYVAGGSWNTVKGNSCYRGTVLDATGVMAVLSNYTTITGNVVVNNASNAGIWSNGQANVVTGNVVNITATGSFVGIYAYSSMSHGAITGNTVRGSGTSNIGIEADVANSISGNNIYNCATGIYLNATNCTCIGNQLDTCTTGVNINANYQTVTSNNILSSTTAINYNSKIGCNSYNNNGVDMTLEKRVVYMKNTSGSTINAGNLVTLKTSVAAGNEITTTTTGGTETNMLGFAEESIANNASGYVLVQGKTLLAKADGTTDIAVGDYLTSFTTAGIVQKATAGNYVIAIAQEAYTTNDSAGVIDALVIPPRIL